MVTRHYDEEEPPFRRYNGRGHGYLLSHERELPQGSNHGPYGGHRQHQHIPHDGRHGGSGQSPEQDVNTSNPRRRIPVACGRCRKRKIRCSGDPGNGGPCTNCKSAGNDTCQFLRVSSTEAHIKDDAADFPFEPPVHAVSRLQCRMVASGPQFYAQPPISLGPDGLPFRHQSLSAFQYPLKAHQAYYGISSLSEFADENIDYGLQGTSYPLMSPDSVTIPSVYAGSNTGRAWNSASQLSKNSNTLFLEQDSSYNQAHFPTNSFPIRSMISSESNKMSLNGMANALPAPIPDRVLPYPAAGRQVQSPFLRSHESHCGLQSSLPIRDLSGINSYNNGLMSANMMNAVKAINNHNMSENASMSSSYLPLANTNPESVAPTQMGCSSQFVNSNQTDLYVPTHSNGLYRQQNDSSSSFSNGYSPGSRKQSQASGHSSPATTLSNGHTYVPYISQSYPQPPMEEMPVPLEIHRSSDAGIQAS